MRIRHRWPAQDLLLFASEQPVEAVRLCQREQIVAGPCGRRPSRADRPDRRGHGRQPRWRSPARRPGRPGLRQRDGRRGRLSCRMEQGDLGPERHPARRWRRRLARWAGPWRRSTMAAAPGMIGDRVFPSWPSASRAAEYACALAAATPDACRWAPRRPRQPAGGRRSR